MVKQVLKDLNKMNRKLNTKLRSCSYHDGKIPKNNEQLPTIMTNCDTKYRNKKNLKVEKL